MILGETEVVPQGTAIYTQTHLLGSSSLSGKGKNIANKREIVKPSWIPFRRVISRMQNPCLQMIFDSTTIKENVE